MEKPFSLQEPQDDSLICVVRVKDSFYTGQKGEFVHKRTLYPLKRKSTFPDLLKEESDMAGEDELFYSIVNIHEVPPGIYELKIVEKRYDWETGILDDWRWKLVLYKEEEEEAKSD